MKTESLAPLEAAVLEKLLAGDHRILAALRAQLRDITVTSREISEAGFFTEFSTGAALPAPVATNKLRLGDVEATLTGLQSGAGFILYIDSGRLSVLEGFTYEEVWPNTIEEFSLRYSDPARRSVLEKLS